MQGSQENTHIRTAWGLFATHINRQEPASVHISPLVNGLETSGSRLGAYDVLAVPGAR